MAFSGRDDLYQAPNFAIMGTGIPERLRRTLPPWTDNPPISPPANPTNPFNDPPRAPHDVDPPEQNPYNDLDFAPFVVTENSSQRSGTPAGGLLGLLQAMMQQRDVGPNTGSAISPNGTPATRPDSDGSVPGNFLRRPPLQPQDQDEADQAQQAREAAAAQLVRGVRRLARINTDSR